MFKCSSTQTTPDQTVQKKGASTVRPGLGAESRSNVSTVSNDRSLLEYTFTVLVVGFWRVFVQLLHSFYPELDVLRTMILSYRDGYVMAHRDAFPQVSATSFSSFGKRMVRSMEALSPPSGNPLQGGLSGMLYPCPSEEFHFKTRVIPVPVQPERDGYSDMWGHFADFDRIDGNDVVFVASSYKSKHS